jgi:hypothetical protein
MTKLEQLKEELERVSNAAFFMSMSDNFCYSTGRIYPLLNKEKNLKKQIAELEKGNEDEAV